MLCARLYTKGAAELLLQQCSSRFVDGRSIERLAQEEKDRILQSFAADGNRYRPMKPQTIHPYKGLASCNTPDHMQQV